MSATLRVRIEKVWSWGLVIGVCFYSSEAFPPTAAERNPIKIASDGGYLSHRKDVNFVSLYEGEEAECELSSWVLVGTVIVRECYDSYDGNLMPGVALPIPVTDIRFRADVVAHGAVVSDFVITVVGSLAPGRVMWMSGLPRFEVGDRYLLGLRLGYRWNSNEEKLFVRQAIYIDKSFPLPSDVVAKAIWEEHCGAPGGKVPHSSGFVDDIGSSPGESLKGRPAVGTLPGGVRTAGESAQDAEMGRGAMTSTDISGRMDSPQVSEKLKVSEPGGGAPITAGPSAPFMALLPNSVLQWCHHY